MSDNTVRNPSLALISRILRKSGRVFDRIGSTIYMDEHEKQVKKWQAAEGDRTLRQIYDLSDTSIVFDIGGYIGQWSSDIFSRYCCHIYVFEPVERYAYLIQERFKNNPKIYVYNFGLSNETKNVSINISDNASSIFYKKRKGARVETVKLVNLLDFVQDHNIDKIDLIKINIEGGEYDLLEYLIKSRFTPKILNIQVQFHNFIENAQERMLNIQRELERTHQITYQYAFVWENWTIKN